MPQDLGFSPQHVLAIAVPPSTGLAEVLPGVKQTKMPCPRCRTSEAPAHCWFTTRRGQRVETKDSKAVAHDVTHTARSEEQMVSFFLCS